MQVYNIYVTDSPLCPINTLMTHGFILTEHGDVSKNMNYENALNELRCAFACGSGMVELYNDYKLMDKINNGKLWSDLADLQTRDLRLGCMERQEVDTHPAQRRRGGKVNHSHSA